MISQTLFFPISFLHFHFYFFTAIMRWTNRPASMPSVIILAFALFASHIDATPKFNTGKYRVVVVVDEGFVEGVV